MAPERAVSQEKNDIWKSRLFKFGLVLVVAGAVFGVSEVAAVGVIAAGGAWALWKGEK
ncbi:MAG: hypothetical protein AAB639_03230 [Patescibacteria group bacterium]